MFCNGNGKVMRKPFSVKNSPEGLKYLIDQAKKSCRHHGIKLEHIFFGGEDCGSYADNFIAALRSDDWVVAGVPCSIISARFKAQFFKRRALNFSITFSIFSPL